MDQARDYVCFIQCNTDSLLPLVLVDSDDYDDFGNPNDIDLHDYTTTQCVTVLVPDTVNIDQLEYHQFANYKSIELKQYNSHIYDFENFRGYRQYLTEDVKSNPVKYSGMKNVTNRAIWRHEKYPGYNLVNFHPVAYWIFVCQENEPQELSYDSYRAILANRDITSYIADKQLLHNLVVGSRVIEPYKIEPLEALPDNGLQYITERCSSILSIIAQYAIPEEWLHEPTRVSSDILIWLRKEGIITKEQRADGELSQALFMDYYCTDIQEPGITKELFSYWNLGINNIIDNLDKFPLQSLIMVRQQRPSECKAAINWETTISLPGDVECLKELVDNWGLIIKQENVFRMGRGGRVLEIQNANTECLQYIRTRFNIRPDESINARWFSIFINRLVEHEDRALYQELYDHWGLSLDHIRNKMLLAQAIAQESIGGVQFLMSLGMTIDDITNRSIESLDYLIRGNRGEAMIKLLAQYGLNHSHVINTREYAVRYGNRNNIIKVLDELPAKIILVIS